MDPDNTPVKNGAPAAPFVSDRVHLVPDITGVTGPHRIGTVKD